ncbi:MAG: AMP-binding protein [bacterium]
MRLDLSPYRSLGEAFWRRVPEHGDRLALIEADRELESARFTYQDVGREAVRVAALLQERGFRPGDHCAIVMSNQSKWIFSGIAVFLAGGVLVPIDYKITPQEQKAYLDHCKRKMVITEWPVWRKWQEAGVRFPKSVTVLVTEAPVGAELRGALRWDSAPAGSFQFQGRERDDVCAILYSSGTGGKMKGCMLTHGNYLTQVENFSAHMKMRASDRYLSILPTNHGVDFVFGFLYPMLVGASVVHQRTLRPQYLMPTLKNFQITTTAFVPMILKEIQKKLLAQVEALPPLKRRLFKGLVQLNHALTPKPRQWLSKRLLAKVHEAFGGKLRVVLTGGSFVDAKLARFFYDLGIFVGIGYGLTEAGTTVSAPVWERYFDDNVGRLLPQTRVEIRNPDPQGVGEIWVQSPSVMAGYFEDPELTSETLVDGWLCTGDLGQLDAQGYLKIKGRKKNLIVTAGGENIYPEDVEKAFEDLPELKEYCVFGTHYLWPETDLLDEKLCMVVHPNDEVAPEQILEKLKTRNRVLADQKRIVGFIVWGRDFPRTGSLKVKRQNLAQEIASAWTPRDIQALQ